MGAERRVPADHRGLRAGTTVVALKAEPHRAAAWPHPTQPAPMHSAVLGYQPLAPLPICNCAVPKAPFAAVAGPPSSAVFSSLFDLCLTTMVTCFLLCGALNVLSSNIGGWTGS